MHFDKDRIVIQAELWLRTWIPLADPDRQAFCTAFRTRCVSAEELLSEVIAKLLSASLSGEPAESHDGSERMVPGLHQNGCPLRNETSAVTWLLAELAIELWPLQAAVQAPGPQPQADAPEAAQRAPELMRHVNEQEALIPAPDSSPATKKRRKRMKPKRGTILEGLVAVYPNGYHQSITPSEAKNKVTPWLEENHPGFVPKTERGLSNDTVRLALKEFEAFPKKV